MNYERLTVKINGRNYIKEPKDGTSDYPVNVLEGSNIVLSYGKAINRLAELEDKIKDGRLVELPCKVGDKFYEVIPGLPVREWIADELIISKERIVIFGWLNTEKGGFWKFWIEDFGKTIFTAKEAAEAKLKELKGEI